MGKEIPLVRSWAFALFRRLCYVFGMTDAVTDLLCGETLLTLAEAAKDFGGVAIPLETLRKYIYRGVKGIKLESVSINGRYTSREAIQRFLDRKQNPRLAAKGKRKMLTQAEVDAGLKSKGSSRGIVA